MRFSIISRSGTWTKRKIKVLLCLCLDTLRISESRSVATCMSDKTLRSGILLSMTIIPSIIIIFVPVYIMDSYKKFLGGLQLQVNLVTKFICTGTCSQ